MVKNSEDIEARSCIINTLFISEYAAAAVKQNCTHCEPAQSKPSIGDSARMENISFGWHKELGLLRRAALFSDWGNRVKEDPVLKYRTIVQVCQSTILQKCLAANLSI